MCFKTYKVTCKYITFYISVIPKDFELRLLIFTFLKYFLTCKYLLGKT